MAVRFGVAATAVEAAPQAAHSGINQPRAVGRLIPTIAVGVTPRSCELALGVVDDDEVQSGSKIEVCSGAIGRCGVARYGVR